MRYNVSFRDKKGLRRIQWIQAESLEELVEKLYTLDALEIFRAITEEELNTIEDREERVQEQLLNYRYRTLTSKDRTITELNQIIDSIKKDNFEKFTKIDDRIYKIENDDYVVYIQYMSEYAEQIMITFYLKMIDYEEAFAVFLVEKSGDHFVRQVIWYEE